MHARPPDSDPPPAQPQPDRIDAGDEDGDEYELEPVDAEVLAKQRQRAAERIDAASTRIDVDELYREAERQRDWDISDFHIRFSVNHMLLATACMAIFFALIPTLGWCAAILIAGSAVAIALASFMSIQESRRKREFYASVREKLQGPQHGDADQQGDEQPPDALGEAWHESFREAV